MTDYLLNITTLIKVIILNLPNNYKLIYFGLFILFQ